jgi:hypothetical protein
MVVLTVGNAYLLCIADAARIDAVNAELATSQGVARPGDRLARCGHQPAAGCAARAGGLPERAAEPDLGHQPVGEGQAGAGAGDRAAARPGVPADGREPYKALDNLDPQAAFAQALKNRKDLAARASR